MTMHPETRAIHAHAAELNGSRPVSVPIYQTSVFAFDDAGACAWALDDPGAGFAYSRYANPTTSALEAVAADLEGGAWTTPSPPRCCAGRSSTARTS
jgi:O-acetylhomoserine/O-acetylserine sulfhydrylase-like pyridoxal-dependent enzyme